MSYDYDPPTRAELRREELDAIERTGDNACPECDVGVVIVGRFDRETGHTEHYCTHCRWSS